MGVSFLNKSLENLDSSEDRQSTEHEHFICLRENCRVTLLKDESVLVVETEDACGRTRECKLSCSSSKVCLYP
jgi:hypothetical protein